MEKLLDKPGAWFDATWLTQPSKLQARERIDGDFDIRELKNDEFGRQRWSKAESCPASHWRAEGVVRSKSYWYKNK